MGFADLKGVGSSGSVSMVSPRACPAGLDHCGHAVRGSSAGVGLY